MKIKILTTIKERTLKNRNNDTIVFYYCYGITDQSGIVFLKTFDK